MTTTISVSEETLERFKQKKKQVNDDHLPELSGDAFVNSLLDTWEMVDEHGYGETHPSNSSGDGGATVSGILEASDDLREQLDRIESAASTAEERTASLPKDVADEVEGRMR